MIIDPFKDDIFPLPKDPEEWSEEKKRKKPN